MADNTKTPLIEAGAGWKKKSAKGNSFLSLRVNLKAVGFDKDVELIGFPNNKKTADNQPDLRFYFSTPREGNAPKQNTVKTPVAAKPVATPAPLAEPDDDMLI